MQVDKIAIIPVCNDLSAKARKAKEKNTIAPNDEVMKENYLKGAVTFNFVRTAAAIELK